MSHPSSTFPAVEIDVIRSPRRKKTVQARLVDGRLRVSIPATMSGAEEAHWVEVMRERLLRKRTSGHIDLAARAERLARALDLPRPTAISWSDRQTTLWGSCTVADGRIRISTRVAQFPTWVLDYVIAHELAHLVDATHGPSFWDLVGRYELTERARGYLIAMSEIDDAS